jgi:phosphoribosylformylglycinamidine cyclo-ligase
MEIYLPADKAQRIIEISQSFGIDAQIVGRVEASDKKQLDIHSEFGDFHYE